MVQGIDEVHQKLLNFHFLFAVTNHIVIDPFAEANIFDFVGFLFIFTPHPFIHALDKFKQMEDGHSFGIDINLNMRVYIFESLQFSNFHSSTQSLLIASQRMSWLSLFGLSFGFFVHIFFDWLGDFVGVYSELCYELVVFFLELDVRLGQQLDVVSFLGVG